MSVDIVNLIESNPITKLSGNYQSKLIKKVQNTFNNYEQQLFLSSFYCYLKYDTKKDFVIDLDNVWKWLGFSQKIKAKQMLEKQFIIDKDYKLLLYQQVKQDDKNHGGHNKETFMLNIDTFKKFCLKAGTKKADEIHEYFIKLENIMFEITKEEGEELKKQLSQIEDSKNKEMEEKLIKQRETILLNEYADSGPLVYIIKVKSFSNGEYVIKIGHSTKGIHNRYNEHKGKYDECFLLNCFSVDKSKDFESFIHTHENIRLNKVTNLFGHEKENELFLIGKNLTYQKVLHIIESNIKNYNFSIGELLKENEVLKMKLLQNNQNNQNIQFDNKSNLLLEELTKTIKNLSNKIDNLEKSNKELSEKISSSQIKTSTGFNETLVTLGPRLQKINPETFEIVRVYETVSEAMKENNQIKRSSINKAIIENTIYHGFRWLFVERNLDPNIISHIEPTKQTKIQNLGYIAKLNVEKNEILNVYLDRKTAAKLNGYEFPYSLDNHVKKNTLSNGHYYKLYDQCDEELINIFNSNYGNPILYKNGIGQYDLEGNLIKEFSCKYDCIKILSISDKTLTKALEKNIPYNGNFFKSLGSKLVVL
uniref:Nuclease-associated modular DNA-binding 1 domain-containing protein n=1 Tax=viral metagenome TaxID=1070528 RepID=A0A6C0DJ53_9ZZZZ